MEKPERIIFVCTANRIRSPFAAALAEQLRLAPRGFTDVPIVSRGTMAVSGAPALREAVVAAARLGVDLTRHRSARLRPDDIVGAWLIGMTPDHIADARGAWRADLLGDFVSRGSVPDPVGQSPTMYTDVFATIFEALQRWSTWTARDSRVTGQGQP